MARKSTLNVYLDKVESNQWTLNQVIWGEGPFKYVTLDHQSKSKTMIQRQLNGH